MVAKLINLGETQYTHSGLLYGPGVVEVPDNIYDDLDQAVERKNLAEGTTTKTDTAQIAAFDPAQLSDDDLIAELTKRKDAKKKAELEAKAQADAAAKAAAEADAAAKAAAEADAAAKAAAGNA